MCSPVSSPGHRRYGQHLTATQVNNLIAPNGQTIGLVEDWLHDHGIEGFTYNKAKDWITVALPVDVVNRLLKTEYQVYRHVEENEVIVRTSSWSLPAHLLDVVETVQPTNSFFRPKPQIARLQNRGRTDRGHGSTDEPYEQLVADDLRKKPHIQVPEAEDLPAHPTAAQACNRFAISPLCLRSLYGTLDYVAQSTAKNRMALVNFLGIVSNRSDVRGFLQRFRPDALDAAYNFRIELVNGGIDDQGQNTSQKIEGNMDTDIMLGIAYPTPLVTYNVGGRPPFHADDFSTENTNEPYLEWLQYMLTRPTLPQVISLSYADDEQTVPFSYAKRVCEGFAQLGARGVTVVFGSGDEGVGRDGKCVSNDEDRREKFLPKFPASCPYVTAVGSTRYFGPEIVGFDARNGFVSGGGFSNYFPRPWYQDSMVNTYLKHHVGDMFKGLYNAAGRGIPDISAMGYHFPIVRNSTAYLIDGTSASAPVVAGIIALVNDALIVEGKPPLGFLNPWLYEHASEAFTDIIQGSNRGCNTTGFPAAEGWDAATGVGTPVSDYLRGVLAQTKH